MVSAVGPAWKSRRGGEIDARITLDLRPGRRSEGGAIVSPDGKLIGMGVTGVGGRALVIPVSTVARAVATLSEKGYVPRGWLGVMLHPVREGNGAIVLSVEAESPAAKAGLLVGDIVTTWNAEAVTTVSNIADRLGAGSVGQTVKLGVSRGGHVSDVDVAIGERPRG
jgi:S1-C subfamily serine protease